ncbi:MAG: hypothetical protein L0Z50_39300, partial [Verrucomicrobiales bacterium]|nr:hypothetical protein [Verrucomicrobiales bacterium]
ATVCPYCTKNVALHTLEKRDPQAFACGLGFFVIGIILGSVIHRKMLSEVFSLLSNSRECCCCLLFSASTAFGSLFLLGAYGLVGFYVGYGLYKLLKSN